MGRVGNLFIQKLNQGALWSKGVAKLDKDKDRPYIIHQTLMYGTLEDIKDLFDLYSRREIVDAFINTPFRIYTPAAFNFVKKFILNLKKPLSEKDYVKRGVVDR